MSVENTAGEKESCTKTNGTKGDHVNGIVNGFSEKHKSSSHKSSSRDKDRDQKHSSSKHSSSSSRDKDKQSSSKDKERSHSHKSSTRDKDKEKSDKDKDRSDKDKHRSKDHKSSRDKDKEREKDKIKKETTGSPSKDKEREKDRHKHKSSTRDKDKDGKHSSSSKDKDRHREKDKDRSRDKDKRSKDKERSRDKSNKESKSNEDSNLNNVKIEIKEDLIDSKQIVDIKSENEDEKPAFNESQSSCDYSLSQFKDQHVSLIKEEEPDVTIKEEPEEDSDGDVPLAIRLSTSKRKVESDSEDDTPINQRKKVKTEKKKDKKKSKKRSLDEESEDEKPKLKKKAPVKVEVKTELPSGSPTKRKKKVEEPQEVWKWWEEEKKDTGVKWNFLEHKGPVFAAPYDRLPSNVKFYYDGKEMHLSEDTEEIACFYARMLEHDYTQKKVFNDNFFKDWRKAMTEKEKSIITDLKKCDFKKMNSYFTAQSEKNKQRTKEEKLKIKEENEALIKEYGFCTIDGHKEKIGNFKIEPPGLFRGRGEHPKMGMVKKRVMPEHVLINCAKNSTIPKAPKGHKWKEVRHDNTVTWLASWTENVQGQVKYIMLNPSSKLKGEKDWQKYETARKLHKCINKIRDTYQNEWKAKEMKIRQRAVALYFIDKLALRAGNEKDEDQADTVGCCSLRVEHITLHKEKDGKEYVVEFDFLGKDSIRYHNEVPVERRVFKNLELFKENKKEGDDLFDRLNTTVMNEHLRELMDGLTAKVFRTYNASITLQNQLIELTDANASIPEKILAYNRANRAVAVLCNHQRAVPKSHDKSMTNLREKMNQKRDQIDDLEVEVKDLAKAAKRGSVKEKVIHEKKKKTLDKLRDQLRRMEVQETDRDENKSIALGTSKLNYLDPRISVAWCKKFDVPLDKIYNKTQRDKFRWAIDMANEDYIF